ncbi:hypothetical protein WBK31_15300 [Nonomuraea sp. N2-4H]
MSAVTAKTAPSYVIAYQNDPPGAAAYARPPRATPMVPPSCCAVGSSPDTDPAASRPTPAGTSANTDAVNTPNAPPPTASGAVAHGPFSKGGSVTTVTASASAAAVSTRGPWRADSAGAARLPAMAAAANGAEISAAARGDRPSAVCRCSISRYVNDGTPALNTNTSVTPHRAVRSRSTDGWISASGRRSVSAKAASSTTEAARPAHVHQGLPTSRPSVSGSSSAPNPAVTSTAPVTSTRCEPVPRAAGSSAAPASEISATGTVTRKTGRQPNPASSPPASGPASDAMPMVAPYRPMARARPRSGTATWMIDRTCGATRPLPAPCTSRAATSQAGPGAAAQASDPMRKIAVPMANSRR